MCPNVRVISAKECLDRETFQDSLERLHLGWARNSRVFIKLNIAAVRSSESGAVVHASIVEELIEYLRSSIDFSEVVIVEADDVRPAEVAFTRLGYEELARRQRNVRLLNLSKCERVRLAMPNAKKLGPVEFPEELLYADYFITVASIRRHVQERYAGVWENQFRCIPDFTTRERIRPFMPEILWDINSFIQPDLAILDGITSLELTGPIEGDPRPIGKLILGSDTLATDIVAVRLIGESPSRIPHLSLAINNLRIRDVTIDGDFKTENLRFISSTQFRTMRLGIRLRQFALYIDNLGYLLEFLSFALSSVGFSSLTSGKLVSLRNAYVIATQLLTRVGEYDTLWDKKIIIGRHIAEQMIS